MALEKVKEKILAEALQKAESKTASAKLAAKEIEKSIWNIDKFNKCLYYDSKLFINSL